MTNRYLDISRNLVIFLFGWVLVDSISGTQNPISFLVIPLTLAVIFYFLVKAKKYK